MALQGQVCNNNAFSSVKPKIMDFHSLLLMNFTNPSEHWHKSFKEA